VPSWIACARTRISRASRSTSSEVFFHKEGARLIYGWVSSKPWSNGGRGMNFRAWLEGMEDYEPFRGRIEAEYRSFAFRYLFVGADENGRIFMPFSSEEMSEDDRNTVKDIQAALKGDGDREEYELVDIKKGYARRKGSPNTIRLGKLLDTLRYKDLKELDRRMSSGELSKMKYEAETRLTQKYYDDIKSEFENMAYRAGSDLVVVISMNAHDIASMSTGRGWTSCMNLADGGHKRDVYCEVRNGGFIAYLTRKDDVNVERPIARIHIRRFDNKAGRSVAVPEESVYGTDKSGFMEVVKSWLLKRQGGVEAGHYRRMGGEYSDTFGSSRKHFVRPDAGDTEKIKGWIEKWMGMNREKRARYSKYMIEALASLVTSKGEYPRDFVVTVRDFLFGQNSDGGGRSFSGSTIPVRKGWNQDTHQFIPRFALRFPEVITKEHFMHAFTYAINNVNQVEMADRLVEQFPQFVDESILKVAKDTRLAGRIADKVPSLSSHHLAMLEDDVNRDLNLENPRFQVSSGDGPRAGTSIWEAQNNITSVMDKLSNFKPIPDRLASKLIQFSGGLDKLSLEQDTIDVDAKKMHASQAKQARDSVLRHAIHVFGITSTDTPVVQRFYKSLLPRWEEAGGIGTLGWGIARLGENGRDFIPFLKKKREEILNLDLEAAIKELKHPMGIKHYKESMEKTIEAFDYVIDTLERGSPSTKYSTSYGVMMDTFIHDQKVRDMSSDFYRKVMSRKS
jgi:hypothetical protein